MRRAAITSAMQLTEEYAISDFRSVWHRHIELVMIIPHKESIRKGYATNSVRGLSIAVIRSMLQPPRFSNTAARTIELVIGASTCALGSQRWRPQRGNFTIKAIMQASHIKTLGQELGNAWVQYWSTRKFREPVVFWIYTNATSSGSDPTSVQNRKQSPELRRSVWLPHRVMMMSVGTSVASNIT